MTETVNIALPDGLRARLDAAAKRVGKSRSALVVTALLRILDAEGQAPAHAKLTGTMGPLTCSLCNRPVREHLGGFCPA